MAEPIVSYEVEVGFDTALKKLQNFEKKMGAFTSKEQKSSRLNQKMMNAHHKEREKHLNKEYASKIKKEGQLSAAHVAAIKQNIKFDKKAADARAKAGLAPKFTGSNNNAHVKAREAELNRQARAESRRSTNLSSAKDTFQRSGLNLKGASTEQERLAQAALRESIAKAKTAKEVRLLIGMERERLRVMKQSERSMNKQSFMMQRMTSSSKQFAGNMLSAFAVAGLGVGITKVGQNFESVNNTMLAVSTNAQEAGQNFKFVRDEAYRLGLGLTESGKNFAKMLSARGKMSLEDTKSAFSGVAEMSTLLGLSAEESTRATNALQQMMSKGVVSAEELKLQMGEVLPNAIQIMAKSAKDAGLTVNGTVAEMMALQQAGGLLSDKVLPHFAKNMSMAARANGGLDKALLSNRVAMNRLMFSFQEAADIIFKSGFSEGLTELFNDMASSVVDLKPLWQALGKIIGSVLKVLSAGVKAITPTLVSMGVLLKDITDILGDASFTIPMGILSAYLASSFLTLKKFLPLITSLGSKLNPVVAAAILIANNLEMAAMQMEELLNLFTQDKVGVYFDPREKEKGNSGFTMGSGFVDSISSSTNTANPMGQILSPLLKLYEFADKIDQGLGLPTWFEATNKTPAWFGSSSNNSTVTVVIGADAEKMGISAAASNAVQNLVDNKVREVQQ